MDWVNSGSDLDLDIDLESGETTSEEDTCKDNVLSGQDAKIPMGRMRCEFLRVESPHGPTNCSDSSSSYEKLLNSGEISANNEGTQFCGFREEKVNFIDKTSDKEKSKKKKAAKPPRPPRGPSLDASDMKLLKEISELNLKRKKMERIRTLKKMKKEKASSLISNLFALLVTVIFLLVIVSQVKVGIPEFLNGVGKGVEKHAEKLESEIGDLNKLLVTRTIKLKRLGIPCQDRKLILMFAHKYRLGLWRPRAEPVKS